MIVIFYRNTPARDFFLKFFSDQNFVCVRFWLRKFMAKFILLCISINNFCNALYFCNPFIHFHNSLRTNQRPLYGKEAL